MWYKRKLFKDKNSVLDKEVAGHIFYARYVGSNGKSLNQAAGVMQYESETFAIETLDKVDIEPNDFVEWNNDTYVVETITKRPVDKTTHFGNISNSIIINLRR